MQKICKTSKNKCEKGFTLLEILIVLVLMALITGLFIDPISRVYSLRAALRTHIDNLHLNVLAQTWFKSTLSSLYMSKSKFVGESKKITGVTFAPLDDEIGLPTSFEWSLFYDKENDLTLLQYKGYGEESITTAEWKGEEGSFYYYDAESKEWSDEWQSSSNIQEDDYKLPLYIRLDGKFDRKPWILLANIDPSRPYQRSNLDKLKKMQEEMKERIKNQQEAKALEKENAKDNEKKKSKDSSEDGDRKKKKDKDE
jgi:prepilin-type N-terminal cleavage/methylation domain-containing protein